jgi:CheY-like chemotaxis protein
MLGLTALVVDDIVEMRRLLARMLRSIGFADVREAGTIADGLLAFERPGVDILLVDYNLNDAAKAGATGGDLVRQVRAKGPAGAAVPILMISGDGVGATIQAAKAAGVDGFLLKPVSKKDLESRVRAALAKRPPAPRVA